MLPHDRIPYSPITARPPLRLPNGARMVCWVIINVEEWDINETMPRTVLTPPAGGAPMPDIPNWAWHEYGNRVGFWRFVSVLDRLDIKAVLALNGSCIKTYAPIAEAARARGWEFLGHGFIQKNMQKVADERQAIRQTREAITAFAGKPPRGWLGPGLTETWETPDLLAEEGYDYVCDWVLDDQPVTLKTRAKPLVNIPYTQECNDRRDDADPAPSGRRVLLPRHRPVQSAVRGFGREHARHGTRRPSLHHGRAAPAALFPPGARGDSRA
jgi:allantoinase